MLGTCVCALSARIAALCCAVGTMRALLARSWQAAFSALVLMVCTSANGKVSVLQSLRCEKEGKIALV